MGRPKGKKTNETAKVEWDDLGDYQAKESWRTAGVESGMEDVEGMRNLNSTGAGGVAQLEKQWTRSLHGDRMAK